MTKRVKNYFRIEPGDMIVVYPDKDNNDLIFEVQRKDYVVNTWTVKRNDHKSKGSRRFGLYNKGVAINSPILSIFGQQTTTPNSSVKEESIKDGPSHEISGNKANSMIIADEEEVTSIFPGIKATSILKKSILQEPIIEKVKANLSY